MIHDYSKSSKTDKYLSDTSPESLGDEMSTMKWILYVGTVILAVGLYLKLEPYLGRSNTLIAIGGVLIVLYWLYIGLFKKK